MSFTFFAKSSAYSWKISFDGQVLCQRIEIGPCALTIIGKPSAATPPAPVAPRRNLRRDTSGFACSLLIWCLLALTVFMRRVGHPASLLLPSARILTPALQPPQDNLTIRNKRPVAVYPAASLHAFCAARSDASRALQA